MPSCCDAAEDFVGVDPPLVANPQRCRVHERDACAFAQQHFLDEDSEREQIRLLQFDKPVVRYRVREQMAHMLAIVFGVKVLQTAVSNQVKKHQNRNHFGIREFRRTMILSGGSG
jgi:hypothetical protein